MNRPLANGEQATHARETLLAAERDHLLDCPNAEFAIRLAATFLDGILLYLLLSGTQNIFNALAEQLPFVPPLAEGSSPSQTAFWNSRLSDILNYVASVTKVSIVYLYCIWPSLRHGGTPGKLLLGLRLIHSDSGHSMPLLALLFRELLGKLSLVVGGSAIVQGMWELSPLFFLAALGFGVALVRPDRRTAFDLLSGSLVKRLHTGAA